LSVRNLRYSNFSLASCYARS